MSNKGTLVVRHKRSGIGPAFVVFAVSGVLLDYDAGHWHLLHHLLGGYSVPIAFMIITLLCVLVVRICKRPEGYTRITEGEDKK